MTFEERKEKMNELRKAHFHLGFKNGTTLSLILVIENTISDYKENYTEKEIARRQKEQNQEFEEYRKNPRKSHYELGADEKVGHIFYNC